MFRASGSGSAARCRGRPTWGGDGLARAARFLPDGSLSRGSGGHSRSTRGVAGMRPACRSVAATILLALTVLVTGVRLGAEPVNGAVHFLRLASELVQLPAGEDEVGTEVRRRKHALRPR